MLLKMKGTTNLTNPTNGERNKPGNPAVPGTNRFFGFVRFVRFVVPSLFLISKNDSRCFRTIHKQYQVLIWPGGGVMLRP